MCFKNGRRGVSRMFHEVLVLQFCWCRRRAYFLYGWLYRLKYFAITYWNTLSISYEMFVSYSCTRFSGNHRATKKMKEALGNEALNVEVVIGAEPPHWTKRLLDLN